MRLIARPTPTQTARIILLLCVSAAALATGACAKRGDISQYASVTGTVVARQVGDLSSVASGNVISVGAQIGQRVHQGQLLVQIDDTTLRAQAAQQAANLAELQATTTGGSSTAQAQLHSAQVAYDTAARTLQRNQQLFTSGYVSKSALDDSTSAAAAAQASLRSAQVAAQNASLSSGNSAATASIAAAQASLAAVQHQLEQTRVSAPFDGVVTQRNVDPGSLAVPGTVLMEVSQLDTLYVDAGVAGSDLGYVRVGTPVTITVAGLTGRSWQGTVRYLNASADPGTSVYEARIPLANADLALRGGMVANVQYPQAHKNGVLLAPRAAVYQTPAGYSMFIIDNGKALEVAVEAGLQNDQQVEVTGPGLKPGVQAILNHSALLQPGTPVQILPPPGAPPPKGATQH